MSPNPHRSKLHPILLARGLVGGVVLLILAALPGGAAADVVINEIMASNRATVQDEDGDYSDWIELHNRAADEDILDGHFLTDDANE